MEKICVICKNEFKPVNPERVITNYDDILNVIEDLQE